MDACSREYAPSHKSETCEVFEVFEKPNKLQKLRTIGLLRDACYHKLAVVLSDLSCSSPGQVQRTSAPLQAQLISLREFLKLSLVNMYPHRIRRVHFPASRLAPDWLDASSLSLST